MCFWALNNIKRFEIETKTGRAAHLYALKGVVKEPVLTQALASESYVMVCNGLLGDQWVVGGGGGRWEGFGGVTWLSVEKKGGRVNRRQQNTMMGGGDYRDQLTAN